ncbi:hypothetical protein VTN02DRAFT_1696 [Thermoascus thermophilus]
MATQSQPVGGPPAPAQATSANSENPSGARESKENAASTSKLWDSERQIVSSLWKLQELEAKIHQLRTLLPDRLLAPLVPIVNPQKAGPGRPVPKTPEILCEQLSQAVRDGVAEVEEFKSMWQSPEMKLIWDRLDEKMKECDGDYPQPDGVWEQDYDVLLEELDREERIKEERRQKDEEEQERLRARSMEGGWKGIVESFRQKGLPGVRILLNKNETVITVVLLKAGMAFDIQEVDGQGGKGYSEWRVSNKQFAGEPKTKLGTGILICLNSRPRKWDLAYLLDMICSYSEVKQTRCLKCNRMTDNAAQLPTIRRPKQVESPDGNKVISWEAYHQDCA